MGVLSTWVPLCPWKPYLQQVVVDMPLFKPFRSVFCACRFVENIPKHVNAKGGFESMAEFIRYYMGGCIRLAAARDMSKGEEVYVQHAPDAVQWQCFHPEKCTSRM